MQGAHLREGELLAGCITNMTPAPEFEGPDLGGKRWRLADYRLVTGELLLATHPFHSPHHTTSDDSLVGGCSTPAPGEISLAHNGVLW